MSTELSFRPSMLFPMLADAVGENRAYSFFDEVAPSSTYGGKSWTIKQMNKWIKANKIKG